MTTLFEQSLTLQLFQHDILDIVTLPRRMRRAGISCTTTIVDKENSNAASTSTTTLDALFDGLICGGYLRQQVEDTLVRIRISPKNRNRLLYANPFQRMLIQEFEREQEELLMKQHRGGNASSLNDNGDPHQQQQQRRKKIMEAVEERFSHRVGKLVGILLKPSLAASRLSGSSLTGGSGSTSVAPLEGSSVATDVARAPDSWRVAVQLGEYTETFPISCVSEDVMREDEHRVWRRTCTRAETNRGLHDGTAGSVGASPGMGMGKTGVLEGEAGVVVRQRLEMVRAILALMKDVEQRGADVVSEELLAEEAHHSPPPFGQKRSRETAFRGKPDWKDNSKDDEEERATEEGTNADSSTSFSPMKLRSMEVKCQRLEKLLADQEVNLSQWREQVKQKEAEVRDLVQQLRFREEESAGTQRSYEDKLREEGLQRQRLEKERDQNLKLLSDASKKLVNVAQMTKRYKGVYDEVVRLVNASPDLSSSRGQTQWKAEDIQEILKKSTQLR